MQRHLLVIGMYVTKIWSYFKISGKLASWETEGLRQQLMSWPDLFRFLSRSEQHLPRSWIPSITFFYFLLPSFLTLLFKGSNVVLQHFWRWGGLVGVMEEKESDQGACQEGDPRKRGGYWGWPTRGRTVLETPIQNLYCPYNRFPISILHTMELYVGKRRTECWPYLMWQRVCIKADSSLWS